jgi:hypothetical protein
MESLFHYETADEATGTRDENFHILVIIPLQSYGIIFETQI